MFSPVKVTAIATLAEDPVIRTMEDRRKMVGLSVYTVRHECEAKAREPRQEKEWHRVVTTDQRLAAYAEAQLAQGDQVYLEGELVTNFCQSEMFELRFMPKICLWREGDKLRRVADEPGGNDPDLALSTVAVARDAHLAMALSDERLLTCVA